MLLRQIKFSASVLFDVIMLHVGMWPATIMRGNFYRKKSLLIVLRKSLSFRIKEMFLSVALIDIQ